MKAFRERNPYVIGIGSVLVIGFFVGLAFMVGILHLLERTYTVKAVFSDAAGVRSGVNVRVAGIKAGRFKLEPGWRWSECVKPVAGTDSCQNAHVGYAVSGALTVRLNDGTTKSIKAGDAYTIPPGHDA